jgi:hypothetical protein
MERPVMSDFVPRRHLIAKQMANMEQRFELVQAINKSLNALETLEARYQAGSIDELEFHQQMIDEQARLTILTQENTCLQASAIHSQTILQSLYHAPKSKH